MLIISVAATTRALLSAAQLRVAAGLSETDTTRDAELAGVGLTVADAISDWCNVGGDGLTPVTLRRETLEETFRVTHPRHPRRLARSTEGPAPLILSRRFLGTVAVVENGATLVQDTDFEIEAGPGFLWRLSGDRRVVWQAFLVVVTYQAGFDTVPTPLASVAAEMVSRKTNVARDPMTRMERIEQVGIETIERQFWVDAASAVDITPDMVLKLAAYRTEVV